MNAQEKLDFTQLTWEQFEDLTRALLEEEFLNVVSLGRTAQGAEFLVEEVRLSSIGQAEKLRWVVQCKHYAPSGKRVGPSELPIMVNTVAERDADGLLLVTSSELTQGAIRQLWKLNDSGMCRTHWWDSQEIHQRSMHYPKIIGRFFGDEAEAWAVEKLEGINWETLRKEYLDAVRERYRRLNLRGLAPELAEGPTDLLLPKVYVPLKIVAGLEPQPEFEVRKSTERSFRYTQPTGTREERSEVSGPVRGELYMEKGEEPVEYELIPRETAGRAVTLRLGNLWDGLALGRTVIIGDPGAGKTTTVRYLALALAHEPETKVDPRFTDHLPIIARLAKYSRRLESEPGLSLVTHLCDQFEKPEFRLLLERELNAQRCVVLLDGLDEVSDLERVVEQIEDFTAGYAGNYIMITSREGAYRRARIGVGFRSLALEPMEDFERICQFIDQWYTARDSHIMSRQNGEAQPGASDIKDALRTRSKLRELARNPLMLVIIILMHWRGTALPNRQIEVYRSATDTLIRYWPCGQDRPGKNVLRSQPIKQILAPIAYRVVNGNGLIGQDELLKRLTEEIVRVKHWDETRAQEMGVQWLDLICMQSGLLAAQGPDKQGKQVFAFLHQRFAEYLAACHLTDCWDKGERDFVLEHVHKPKWAEIVTLFVAQAGLDRWVLGTKALQAIVDLNSPWEEVVWRDHLVAGRCMGEDFLVEGELPNKILTSLTCLLTDSHERLRASVVEVFATLSGTQYRDTAIEYVRGLLERDLPWRIKVDVVETLFRLGEREQSPELLIGLRECAKRRGYSKDMSRMIELLLEGWKEETVDWLIDVAQEYNGRGLMLEVRADPYETVVAATDESFGPVRIGEHLERKAELREFISRLMRVLTLQEQQERAQWVRCRLSESSADEIRALATEGHDQRVRQLSAEWLAEHDERELGVRVLAELATQGDGNLLAATALMRLGETERALHDAWTTLATFVLS